MFLIEPDKGNNYFYLIHPPFIFILFNSSQILRMFSLAVFVI